jgi:hypothetical protein
MHGDPWRWVRELPHITVLWSDDLPADVMGYAHFGEQTVVLANGLTQAERRSTCWHEVLHLQRGPVPRHLAAREEREVEHRTARDLIPFAALVQAMLWSRDDHEIADELTVDVGLVRARLDGLSAGESDALERALDEAELLIP